MDAVYSGFSSTRSSYEDFDDDDEDSRSQHDRERSSTDGYTSGGGAGGLPVPDNRLRSPFEADRKKRRAIANSNERKRMQSINAGFQSLRSLVCPKSGEKLSKAAILKHTGDFIKNLLAEKQQLLIDNKYLEQLVCGAEADPERRYLRLSSRGSLALSGKRRYREGESTSSDEGIGLASVEEVAISGNGGRSSTDKTVLEMQRKVLELQEQVEREKALRLIAEVEKNQVEKLQLQQRPQLPCRQLSAPLSYSRSTSCSSSDASNSNQTLTTNTLGDLWRRGLETIVEAIRHVEGEESIFGSPQATQPEPASQTDAADGREPVCPSAVASHAMPSLVHRQLPTTCVWNASTNGFPSSASLPNPVGFARPFHRPSLAAPSS